MCDDHTSLIILLLSVVYISLVCVVWKMFEVFTSVSFLELTRKDSVIFYSMVDLWKSILFITVEPAAVVICFF